MPLYTGLLVITPQLPTLSKRGFLLHCRSSMPEVDELRTILESGDITGLFSSDELSECPRLSSSLVNIPTYCMHAITRHSFYFMKYFQKDILSLCTFYFRN